MSERVPYTRANGLRETASKRNKLRSNADIGELLRNLDDALNAKIEEFISDGKIRLVEEVRIKKEYSLREDTDDLSFDGCSGDDFSVKSLSVAGYEHYMEIAKSSHEFQRAERFLNGKIRGRHTSTEILYSLTKSIFFNYFRDDRDLQLEDKIKVVQRYLAGMPMRYFSEVLLVGIIAPSKEASFTSGRYDIKLRSARLEDFPKEVSVWEEYRTDWLRFGRVTSVLRIETPIMDSEAISEIIQSPVNQAITILRLFKVGSVTDYHVQHGTEAFWNETWMGRGNKVIEHGILLSARVSKQEGRKFEEFWHRLQERLPSTGFSDFGSQTTNLEIAYSRYSDSLLAYRLVGPERRISDAVMGWRAFY